MNEEALKDAYNQFANTGYDGDQNEFYTLLSENSEAFADSYGLFKGSGYDGSEDDYKTLLGLKKKDDSVVSSILPQTGSEDTPLQSELSQPSLEETSQNSLEERFSGYMDMPDEDKFKLAKQEDKRPFYESQGVDYDKFLLAKQEEEEVISTNEEQEEEDEESSWAGKWYDRLSNWSEYDEEQTELAEKDTSSRMYLAKNKEGIKSADLDYDNALFQSIIKNSKSSKQFAKAIQESGIDQNNIRMPEMQIDGQDASMNEWIDYWLDSDNVSTQKSIAEENEDYDEAVNGGMDPEEASEKFLKTKAPNYSITVDENFSDNPNYKSLEYAKNLMNRQLESGGMIGDWGQNLLATTIDLGAGLLEQMEKVPAGLGLKPSPLADSKEFDHLTAWELYMQEGGYYYNKVHEYAEQVRELTRIPEEQSIAESFLEGNFSDVLFNAGNGVANAIPFTLSVAATGGGNAGLLLVSSAAGGLKSGELKARRRGGEDIENWQIHFSEGVTIVSEGFFERYTQGIIKAARKAGKIKGSPDPNILLDSYLQGIKKSILVEVPSEMATEGTQYLTDAIPAVGLEEFDAGEFAVRMVDTAIISALFGTTTYVTTRGATEISRNLGVINENTTVIFTNEKGEKKEMSRGEAVNFARDPEIAQQIRDGKLKPDYSMNDAAREAIENLVYGESAPDAVEARNVMRKKETVVQDLSTKIAESEDVSTEDINNLSKAVTEMEAEGKVSKYNESETTVATRKKVQAILKEKGIEITNATQTQDVSTSKVTNTTEINKINTEEEYRSIKKQVKDKRIPKVVTSETQKGITVNGKSVQESEVTQGKFKNIAAAKNAVKEYESIKNATNEGATEQEFTSDELANPHDAVKSETYETTGADGNKVLVTIRTAKDGSRQLKVESFDENGDSIGSFNADKFGKDNPTSNEMAADVFGLVEQGEATLKLVETKEGFENNYSEKQVEKRKEKRRGERPKGTTDGGLFPINNRLFIKTNKDSLDEVPQEVLDSKEYYVLTSEKEGLNAKERASRMVELKSDLDKAGAKYYTVQGVYNGVAEESLVVTGLNEGQALTIGRQFAQESIFSAKKGLMFSNGAVVPLNGDAVEGVDARKRDALTIMNVGGKKVSLHTGLDWSNMSHGKNFNPDNAHRLNDSDPNYDKELFDGITEDRKRILGFAFKLLNSIGGLNVTVIRNSEAMKAQIKSIQKARYIQDGMLEVEAETDSENYAEDKKRGSFFVGNTIHINLETVQGNTLFHEIIHPMVDFIKANDAALYSRIEQEVTDSNVKRRTTLNGKKMKGSYLEWAQNNTAYAKLSREEQIEEAFAEMMGDAAYGHFKNRQSKLNRIRGVIKAMLNKLGMTSLPENVEAIDLATMSLADMNENLVGAFLDGRKITVGGVEFEVGESEAEPKFQLDAVDKRTGIQYTYDKNSKVFAEMEADGRITSGKTIQDFKGKKMMFHAPDAMFSGSIIDADGTILIEGKGGVMYPFVFNEEGYFWASTDNAAEKMAEQLNSMMDENDGKIYMALTTATQDKLLSSTAASRGILNLFSSENFIKKIGMNKSQLYKAVIEAANNVSTVTKTKIDKKTGEEVKSTKKIGLDLKLKPYRASSDFNSDIVEKIWSKLDNSTSSFDDRKNFSDKLLTNIKKFKVLESKSSKVNFVNFINTTDPSLDYSKFNKDGSGNINSLKKAIINVLTEPSLREKDGDTNRIYAVLEIDGPVKPINTKENPNVPDYESYGTAIVSESKNRTTIHRLDNRDFWYDVTEEPGTNAIIGGRERLSSSDKMSSIASQIMPSTAGVSTTPLKISEKIRMQAPSYDMEYTPNALVSLSMIDLEMANTTEWISKLSKGVKGTSKDIATMGLEDILKAYQKEAKVKSIPKEVVAQLIATNMAEIETKILSKNPVINYDDYYVGYDGDTYGITTPEGLILNSGVEVTTEVEELSDNERKDIIEEGLDGLLPVSKYSEVTLPGGDNYREFLIRDKSSEDIFTAPHYDDFGENLIASVRADDRVGPNGEKVLFVQEIQSDWVQGTNKDNFKTKNEVKELESKLKSLRLKNRDSILENVKPESIEYIRKELSIMYPDGQGAPLLNKFKEEIERLSNQLNYLKPYLPWNQTDLWLGLAIRKVINQASKEGYDQIAFVNGEQSDIVQGHSGENKGTTHKFYNTVVPPQINKELKRLVKGMRYEGKDIQRSPYIDKLGWTATPTANITGRGSEKQYNAVINLTPELKAATDKVGPLRFQVNEEITDDQLQTIKSTYSDIKEKYPNINIDGDRINLYHYSNDNLESVDPDAAVMSSYSREEFKTWGRGRVFFYTDPNLKEGIVTSQVKNETSLPIDKVYPLTEDPLGLSDIALANIKEKRSGGNKTMSTITIDTKVLASANISISHFKAKLRGLGLADVVNFESVEENNSYAKNKDGKYVKDGVENVRLSVTYPEGSDNITSLIKETFDGSSFERINPATIPINTFEELAIAADNLGFQGFIYDHVGGKTVSSWKAVGVTKDRFQAAREEGETNNYTDGAFTIGWDISKALQDADYAAGRYLSGLIDQKKFSSKKTQRYDIRLTTLLLKPIGTHSDKEVKEIMVRSRGSLNAELLEANLIKRRLEKANKEANLSPKEINDLLHNLNDVKAMEDSDIKMALLEMRAHVDRLSNTLISEGLIDGQTMFTVDANLGFYITKSYKNFEVKGWEQTDNLIIKKAKTFLYNEAKKDNPEASEDQLLNIVDKSFEKLTEEKEFAYNMRSSGSLDGLTRVSSIFEEKKVIPQEIKDLWGEIDNPLFNYNNTVKKLAQTVTAERMYRDILEIGKGRFISDTYDRNSTINELKGAKWGSLDGKFVDNEMFSVMNQMNPEGSEGSFAWVYDFYMNMVLFNKKMKTVWNPGTHVKNLVGNTAFATMNGHLNPLNPQMYKDGITSIKTVTGMKTPELQELYKKLTAKGVVSSSASLEEIRGIAKDLAQSDFDLSEYLDEKNGKVQKLAAKAKRAVGKPYNYLDKKFAKAYQAEDDVWKIFGYLSEKARYVKAGLTEKEADNMAARNIIKLYPNYAEIPRAIRYIGRSPLVGSFVAFQAESVRNSKNTVVLGFEEMGSSNPKIRKIGATRIAGTIATMALLEGLQLYTLQFLSESLGLSGGDEEESEQRKIRTLVADWDKSGSLGYVDSGSLDTKTNEDQMENDKYFDYINFSSISGVGYIKDIMRLAFEDIETQAGKESSFRIMEKVFAPFISEEMTLGAMLAAYNNEGGKVYNRTDDSLTKLSKMLMFVGDQIKPGVVSSGVRVYNSMDEDSDRVPLYETMALFGLRINRGNANKSLAINSRTAYNDMRERTDDNILRSKSLLQKELLVNPDLDNDLSIISDLMSAARLNKVAGEDTRTILKGMGVSNIVIDLAYNRMINNYKQDIINVDAK